MEEPFSFFTLCTPLFRVIWRSIGRLPVCHREETSHRLASAQPSQDWSCGLVGGSLQLQGTLPSCVPVPCVSGGRPGETGEVGREDGSHGTESRLAPNHVLNVFLYIYIAMGSEKTTVSPTVFKRLMCTHTTWVAPRVVLTCSKRVLC